MDRVLLLPTHGKKPTNKGFTILEIIMFLFLIFVLISSFFYIRKNHQKKLTISQCEELRWQWLSFVEDIQQRVYHWQSLGGKCLKSGVQPMSTQDQSFVVSDITSTSLVLAGSNLQNEAYVSAGHSFSRGNHLLVCRENQSFRRQLDNLEIGQTRSLLKFAESTDGLMPVQNDLIASVFSIEYEAKQEGPNHVFLYQKIGAQLKPIFTQLTSFKASPSSSRQVDLEFAKGSCTLKANLSWEDDVDFPGVWSLQDHQLQFSPWPTTPGAL